MAAERFLEQLGVTFEPLLVRKLIVVVSGLVYWAGVSIQARRVRKQIGRSPNLKPRGTKEKLLWVGWLAVIAVWLGQPWLIGAHADGWVAVQLLAPLMKSASLVLGAMLVAAGYAGTLWCYFAMGNTWRIGINRKEKTELVTAGPYRLVRHPIYLFQLLMLLGAALLLPTILSLVILALHLTCIQIKASDEEAYLLGVHGEQYRDYLARSGRLFPKVLR